VNESNHQWLSLGQCCAARKKFTGQAAYIDGASVHQRVPGGRRDGAAAASGKEDDY
jgi:hypothetical protein